MRAQRFSTLLLLPNDACSGKAALRQTRSPRRLVPRHRCGQPRPPAKTDRTTHQSQRPLGGQRHVALDDGLVRFRTALDEHGAVRRFVPPPADARDYRRIRRPTRALPSRLLGGRSPRTRTKNRVDFAALRVPKHTIKKHAPRETTNVPTPPSPSEGLLEKYKSRHEERPWAQPPTPKARPKIPVAPTPPPPPPPPSPYSPNTKKSLLTVVKKLGRGPRRLLPQAKEAHQGGHVVAGIF